MFHVLIEFRHNVSKLYFQTHKWLAKLFYAPRHSSINFQNACLVPKVCAMSNTKTSLFSREARSSWERETVDWTPSFPLVRWNLAHTDTFYSGSNRKRAAASPASLWQSLLWTQRPSLLRIPGLSFTMDPRIILVRRQEIMFLADDTNHYPAVVIQKNKDSFVNVLVSHSEEESNFVLSCILLK